MLQGHFNHCISERISDTVFCLEFNMSTVCVLMQLYFVYDFFVMLHKPVLESLKGKILKPEMEI